MISGSLSRNAGGLFQSVRALSKELCFIGADIRVYGLKDINWERDAILWHPIDALAFSYYAPRFMAWSPLMDDALDGANSDLLHLHGLWQYSSIATLRQWKKRNIPYLISPRGMLDSWALANSGWKKAIAARLFENSVLRNASCLHALCESEATSIHAYGLRQRIEVVPNGVELPEKLTTEDKDSTEGKKRLLFLGRIHPKKGLVGALRAWAELRNSPSAIRDSAEWQFVIAGWDQGGHEEELKSLCRELGLRFKEAKLTTEDTECTEVEAGLRLAGQAGAAFSNPTPSELVQDYESASLIRSASGPAHSENLKLNSYKLKTERSLDLHGGLRPENGSSRRLTLPDVDVVFFGPVFGDEKDSLLRSAEAFILPSFSEGLPMSVLEAWAYGLPVVMTPECNLPEGFVCQAALEIRNAKMGNEKWDGLRALIEMTDQERAAMGMRGRRLVEERFTWPKIAAQMKALYEDVLNAG